MMEAVTRVGVRLEKWVGFIQSLVEISTDLSFRLKYYNLKKKRPFDVIDVENISTDFYIVIDALHSMHHIVI